jgi:nuclear GTP-binding protein
LKHSEYNDDPIEFLSIIARKGGRLLKGGEADVDGVAKMVLNDFLRGKIPWFSLPPKKEGEVADPAKDVVEGREGRLGEMPGKRKADVVSEVASTRRKKHDKKSILKFNSMNVFVSSKFNITNVKFVELSI